MTPSHHPSEETLAAFAAGSLRAGPGLVVATHLSGCAACRRSLRGFEAVGGALLETLPPADLSPDLLERTLAALDAASMAPAASDAPPPPRPPGLDHAPAPLLRYAIGPWRFIAPGVRWSRVTLPEDPEANVILLKAGPGRKLPQHGHEGAEYTQVLSGSFSDATGRYRPGDCIEVDDDVDHQPVVDDEGECICLAAVDGRLRLHSLLGRLLQPFIGL